MEKFDQKKYINEYKKKNYKTITVRIKPELKQELDNYLKKKNITMVDFIKNAIEETKKEPKN